MKEITILSGKGGTGKTSISSAFASLAKNSVFCDNDVDAADLHLIFKPEIEETHVYKGAWEASINQNQCNSCGLCAEHCRFDAIEITNHTYQVNPYKCEGCRLCERICPTNAIQSQQSLENQWFISNSRFGKLVHAKMKPGEENSGKLVTVIRNKAREIAKAELKNYIINDGPPGIGCSAISSITGTHLVVLVVEPSLSGLHDAKRLVTLVQSFNIPMLGIINKADLNADISDKINQFFTENDIDLIASIPFDEDFVHAAIQEKNIVEFNKNSSISALLTKAWQGIEKTVNINHDRL